MAKTSITLACTKSAFITKNNPNTNYHGAGSYDVFYFLSSDKKRVLLGFDGFPSQHGKKVLYSWMMQFSAAAYDNFQDFNLDFYDDDFDANSITFNNDPLGFYPAATIEATGSSVTRYTYDIDSSLGAKGWIKTKTVAIDGYSGSSFYRNTAVVYTNAAAAANRPAIVVEYDDSLIATSQVVCSSPASGLRVDPTTAITFSWSLRADPYYSVDPFVQVSATFYWSSDDGATWNSVAASGSTQSVTIPANTFPAGTILWKVTATDDRGATTTSGTRTVITEDTLPTTTLIQPINTLESNNQEILFRWQSTNASGTEPTSYRLAWRDTAVTPNTWYYQEFPAGTTEWLAPANTFPASEILWEVLARNRDGNPGPWSSHGRFQSVGAPAAPVVSCDGKPFATIDWQASGQQAWRITVDGSKIFGPYFGDAKSFTLPDYLEDGPHTAAVEVQGSYGLWSDAGEVAFTVTNVPGDDVTLEVTFYRDAELRWTSDSTTADWLVYRDGVRIGHTAKPGFADRMSIGLHDWQVVNRLADGYYTASNAVRGELKSCTPAISLLGSSAWMELKKSDTQDREDVWQQSQTAAIRHFAGEVYPTAEFSAWKDETVSLQVAWTLDEAEEARSFEALIGRIVVYKYRDRMMVGALQGFNLRLPQFYRAYSFTLTRVHWRDYVDENP